MKEVHAAYTQYVRATGDNTSLKSRKMADKGFKFMFEAMEAKDALEKYHALLKKKYKSG